MELVIVPMVMSLILKELSLILIRIVMNSDGISNNSMDLSLVRIFFNFVEFALILWNCNLFRCNCHYKAREI